MKAKKNKTPFPFIVTATGLMVVIVFSTIKANVNVDKNIKAITKGVSDVISGDLNSVRVELFDTSPFGSGYQEGKVEINKTFVQGEERVEVKLAGDSDNILYYCMDSVLNNTETSGFEDDKIRRSLANYASKVCQDVKSNLKYTFSPTLVNEELPTLPLED